MRSGSGSLFHIAACPWEAYNSLVPLDLNRRHFVLGTGASLLASSVGRAATTPVIDTHIHFFDPRRPGGIPWPPKSDSVLYRPVLPQSFAEVAKPAGVTGAIVIEASARIEDNQWVLDLVKDSPMIVGFVANLTPGNGEFRANLARFHRNPLVRGIRLFDQSFTANSANPAYIDDLRRLADADLMLDAIGETDSQWLGPLLTVVEKLPQLRVCINHMPEMPPGWKPERMRALAAHPNVYCKVSGIILQNPDGKVPTDAAFYKPALDRLWDIFGEDRVMYGSNWPKTDHRGSYATVFKLAKQYVDPRGPAVSEKFFSKNSRNCYKWTERG